jgi:hypothetical protein
MHITYDPDLSRTDLMQGDVLRRTSALDELLKTVHPHFYQHPKNRYFLVLTQSCDLVIRQGGQCKAPYISLAPVRSLDLVLDRQLSQSSLAEVKAELPVVTAKNKQKLWDFLHRLFNNNESTYFYLDSRNTPLETDCVAFLNLSIAIKAELHFQTCLNAKILQLDNTFQAKLGWLVGQMYSRVGTPDWESKALNAKVRNTLKDAAIWVEDADARPLVEAFKQLQQAEGQDAQMTASEVARVISLVPTKKQRVMKEADRIIKAAVGEDQAPLAEKIRKRLDNDTDFSSQLQ